MSKLWAGILTVSGFIACPCHLPLTLPILLGILGGTGVGSFIGAHTGLIYGLATGYFILVIGVGVYLWNRKAKGAEGADCELTSQTASPPSGNETLGRKSG